MTEKEEKKTSAEKGSPTSEEETSGASSQSDIKSQLKEALEEKERAASDSQDRYLRTLADFENYKKRNQKEQREQIKFANERLLRETLTVIDNLERAISHSKESSDLEKLLEGVILTQKQLLAVLDKFGVRPIESLNHPFDPNLHQSVGQVDIEEGSDVEEGHVASEAQKGYFFHDRLLRPSLVVVAKKKQTVLVNEEKDNDTAQSIDEKTETLS